MSNASVETAKVNNNILYLKKQQQQQKTQKKPIFLHLYLLFYFITSYYIIQFTLYLHVNIRTVSIFFLLFWGHHFFVIDTLKLAYFKYLSKFVCKLVVNLWASGY